MQEDETKAPTRAALLEQCRAAGLKATGWKKERMIQELAKLAKPESDLEAAPEKQLPTEVEVAERRDEEQDGEETIAPKNSGPSRRLSGWCQRAPMWSDVHLTCQRRQQRCDCGCHAEGWERPPVPEGAQLSKFKRPEEARSALPPVPAPLRDWLAFLWKGVDDGRLAGDAERAALYEAQGVAPAVSAALEKYLAAGVRPGSDNQK